MIQTINSMNNSKKKIYELDKIFLNYSIFYSIFFLYRILFTFKFMIPYNTDRFREFIDIVFIKYDNLKLDTKSIKNLFKNQLSEDDEIELEQKSNLLEKKNKKILNKLFSFYGIILCALVLINLVLFIANSESFIQNIKNLSKGLLFKILFNILWISTISFSFNMSAVLPYYKNIILKYL